MAQGKAPKTYGLILSKQQKGSLVVDRPKLSAFTEDDEDDVANHSRIHPLKSATQISKVKRHVQNQIEQALREFDNKQKKDEKREPKYVKQLLKAAQQRQHEYDAREERKQANERQKERDREFDDKEVFVTSAYRRKMEELDVYKEEEARKQYIESVMDVTRQQDISGFYKHLLNDMTTSSSKDGAILDASAAGKVKGDVALTDEVARRQTTETIIKEERIKHENTVDDSRKPSSSRYCHRGYRRERASSSSSDDDVKQPNVNMSTIDRHDLYTFVDTKLPEDGADERPRGIQRNRTASKTPNRLSQAKSGRQREICPTSNEISQDEHAHKAKQMKSTVRDKSERVSSSYKEPGTVREEVSKNGPNVKEKLYKKAMNEREEAEMIIKRRLETLRRLLVRQNSDVEIEAYRQRFLERKARKAC